MAKPGGLGSEFNKMLSDMKKKGLEMPTPRFVDRTPPIRCHVCGVFGGFYDRREDAKRILGRLGWTVTRLRAFCPEHTPHGDEDDA